MFSIPASASASPLLSELFDDIATLPAGGWVLKNESTPPGTTGWFQGNPAVFGAAAGAADSYIAANFNNAAFGGAVSNWLMTPQLALANGASLNFALRLLGEGVLDRVEVYLSTAGASDDTADFGLLGAFAADADTGWVDRSFIVGGLAAPASGRFAFRYVVDDTSINGDYIGIDALSVDIAAIPVPGSVALIALGVAAMVGTGRWRRQAGRPRRWPALAGASVLGLSALAAQAQTQDLATARTDGVMRFPNVELVTAPGVAVVPAAPVAPSSPPSAPASSASSSSSSSPSSPPDSLSARPAGGFTAYKDPATGRLTGPSAEQAAALDAAAPGASRRMAAPQVVRPAHGGKAIMLNEERDSHVVATRGADGGVSEVCVPGRAAALAAMQGERP